jgi:hypothetical protein
VLARLLHQLLPVRRRATSLTTSATRPAFTLASPHPIVKLSVPLSKVNYYLVSPHPNIRGLRHYIITANSSKHWGLRHYFVTANILGYLVNFFSLALDISSPAQWNHFLRLSGIIFFDLVALSSSAQWI